MAQQLSELANLRDAQRQLMKLVTDLNNAVLTSEERIRKTITTTTTTVTEVSAEQQYDSETSESSNNVPTDNSSNSNPGTSTRTSTTTTTVSAESVSKLKLEFSRFQKKGCNPECECTCHQRRRYRTPSFAQNFLGELLIGFSSLPLLTKGCSELQCKQKTRFSATVTYNLPKAFFSKVVSLIYITTSQGDPAACLKIRPLSTDFSIYRAVESNDLIGVRNMIDCRSAHPSASFKG